MAALYWVGGSGNWSDATNHWSTSSGGSPGAGNLPTSADDVNFDSASNTTAYTVTIDATTKNCKDFNMAAPASGKVTWAGSVGMNIYGALNLSGGSAGITKTHTGLITFKATSGTQAISSNGVAMISNITFDGVGGTWQLSNALSISTSGTITLTNGTFNSNGFTVTGGTFSSSNSNTRVLTLGASTFNLETTWNIVTTTGLTFNANTSSINLNTFSSFNGGSLTYYNVSLTAVSPGTITGANTYNNLTLLSNTNIPTYIVGANQVVSAVFTVTGTSIRRCLVISDTMGTQRTITAATTTLSYVDFTDMIGAGAGSWSGTSIGNADNNSGITFTTPVTRYWVGGTGDWDDFTNHWSAISNGSPGATMPIVHDTAIFNASSFSGTGQTVTVTRNVRAGTVNFTGVGTDNPAFVINSGIAFSFYNSFTLSSGMTFSGTASTFTYFGRRNSTFTSNTVSVSTGTTFSIDSYSTNTLTLGSDLTVLIGSLLVKTGHLDLNDYNTSVPRFDSNVSTNRTISMGSGTMTLTSVGTIFNFNTTSGLTFNCETSTIKITDSLTTKFIT